MKSKSNQKKSLTKIIYFIQSVYRLNTDKNGLGLHLTNYSRQNSKNEFSKKPKIKL